MKDGAGAGRLNGSGAGNIPACSLKAFSVLLMLLLLLVVVVTMMKMAE